MATGKNQTVLYLIIAVLVMALAASIGYNIGSVNNTVAANKTEASGNSINKKVLKEIEDLKTIYDSKIAEKRATYKDLQAEKEKVQTLLSELEKSKGDAQALLKYKDEYQNLEAKMHVLVKEIGALKSGKSKVVNKAKSLKPLITEVRKPKINPKVLTAKSQKKNTIPVKTDMTETRQETAVSKPEIPERKAEKTYAPLNITQVKAGGFISKSAYVKEETTSATKTDLIKITFSLEANDQAKAEEKKYFIQVVDGNNKVLGKRITEFFDDKSIIYSLSRSVFYENDQLVVNQELLADEFQKGTYTVNIYERSRLVGKATFTLK